MEYINTPFNYTGNKFKLLEQIIPEMDYSKKFFCDIFAGGGSVYTNIIDKYEHILINDIIKDLISIHKLLINDDNFVNNVKLLCPKKDDKEGFIKLRTSYNENKTPEKLYALMLSSTNNMIRFNQKFNYNQTFGKRSFSNSTQKKIDCFINHLTPYKNKITYISEEFYKIKVNKDCMVYMDMPYGYSKNNSNNKDLLKQMNNKQLSEAGYNNFWLKEHEIKLYNYCKRLNDDGASFVLSGVLEHNGNTSWILDKLIIDGFKYKEFDFNYKKVSRTNIDKKTKEIIVKNF
jgi:site-specific DNA-adenine methylase